MVLKTGMSILGAVGRYVLMIKEMFSLPGNRKVYWKELMFQCVEIGIGSLGIVSIVSVFIGAVSTVQTAYQLVSPLLSKSTIGQVVRSTVILEFAPTLTCLVLAGVIGSKIASELGNMRVNEQIDALEIMGVNTKAYLGLPKILACLIMIPFLVIISMALGIYGGRLAAGAGNVLSTEMYDRGLLWRFSSYNIIFALTKAYMFAFIISSVPIFHGYYVNGGSQEIGRAATKAVIISCIMVLFSDFVLSVLFL